MFIRFSLLFSLALAACSDDPKPAEPVAKTDAPAAKPTPADETPAPAEAAAEPVAAPPVIAVQAMAAPKAGAKSAPASTPANIASKDKVTKDTLWVFVDGANIRATPSLTGKIVGKLTWSTPVESLGTTNGFVKIAEGQFVHRKMLTDRKARFGHAKPAH